MEVWTSDYHQTPGQGYPENQCPESLTMLIAGDN